MANRYFVDGGVDSSSGSTLNWSETDGGAGGASVPGATDNWFLTANSPNCTITTPGRNALTVNCTGYTGTLNIANTLTISGSLTLSAAMTITGASYVNVNASATLTSNGKSWTADLKLTNAATFTLADNWAVTGVLTLGGTTSQTATINGNQITASGGVIHGLTTGSIVGTTVLRVTGGTVTGTTVTTGDILLPIVIAGNVTVAAEVNVRLGTMLVESGTVTTASGAWATGGSSPGRVLRGRVLGGVR